MNRRVHRRTFLKAAAAGAAAAGFASAGHGSASAKRTFTMNLNPGMISVSATPQETLELAVQYGFESVTPSAAAMAKMTKEELDALLEKLKTSGLKWGAAPLGPFFADDEAQFAQKRDQIAGQARVLQAAGATRAFTWTMPSSDALTYRANFQLHVRRLREIGRLLADHGLRIGLEYVGTRTLATRRKFPFVRTLAETKELVDETGLESVGITLDSWHWFQAGDTEEDILRLTSRNVVEVHICDAPRDVPREQMPDSPRKLPCATGVIDLRAFLSGLLKIGYDGPVDTEPFDPALRQMSREQALSTVSAAMKQAFALVD